MLARYITYKLCIMARYSYVASDWVLPGGRYVMFNLAFIKIPKLTLGTCIQLTTDGKVDLRDVSRAIKFVAINTLVLDYLAHRCNNLLLIT